MKIGTFLTALTAALLLGAAPLAAQDHAEPVTAAAPSSAQADAEHADEKYDIITPHITDGNHMEVPWILPPFFKEVTLPHWEPIHVGPLTIDLSPTKHVIFLMLGAVLLIAIMILVANAHVRATQAGQAPKGGTNAIEAMILYIRNEVILPNVGHHGEGFVPYLLTVFFFILTLNLLGLVPYGSTATGNISVTATLAVMTFITVEIAGIRANGWGYLNTIFYWNNELPLLMRPLMFLIMSPVEMIGKLTKPFALAIRLFANMTAGHIVVLAFMGLFFTFLLPIGIAPLAMAVAIMLLELFVAFLQAFIFTLLSSVFIGQIREAHH
ncbi:MAG: F0F1 ATP synthase subunit A [Gemmatimonadaceae bacterium]|nr:F0F1 ATP synthase subunit A [Gemmatimonadaceae bacterium]